MEDIINDFEEIDNQMTGIIDDLNESICDEAYIEDSETEVSKTNDTEMAENTSQFEDITQPQQRTNREKTGQVIACLEPTFAGKRRMM